MSDYQQHISRIKTHLTQSAHVKQACITACTGPIIEAATLLAATFDAGHKALFCGNGGSAADCQHMAAELVVRLSAAFERPALSAIALTTDTSLLTAYSNDYSFDGIFERQIQAHGRANDTLVAISTSGNSPNILRGLRAAKAANMKTIGLTGASGGDVRELVDVLIAVPNDATAFVQEAHLAIEHLICEIIEQILFPDQASSPVSLSTNGN